MTCCNLEIDLTNIFKYFRNRPSDVPPPQNLSDLESNPQNTSVDHAVEIPVESLESSDNPSGFKVPFRWPVFTVLVSVIQLAIFSFAMEEGPSGWVFETFGFDPRKRHQIWRLLTNLFLHFSKLHLGCNLISQLLVGLPLEIVHGWKRISILYFCSGLIGTLTQFTLNPLEYGMGASGAIFGLLAGNLAAFIMNWDEIMDPIRSTVSAVIDIILSLFTPAVILSFFNEGEKYSIGHAAHVGGALGGLTVGVFVLKTFQKAQWKTKLSTVCIYIAAILVVFGLGANTGEQIFYWKVSEEFGRLQELAWNNYNENCTGVI